MSGKMKGILIDVVNKEIKAIEFSSTQDLHNLLGGYLECAYAWRNGDILYVDENGLQKDPQHWFLIHERADQLLAGNGVIVGREYNDDGDTHPPFHTVDQVKGKVLIFHGRSWSLV